MIINVIIQRYDQITEKAHVSHLFWPILYVLAS